MKNKMSILAATLILCLITMMAGCSTQPEQPEETQPTAQAEESAQPTPSEQPEETGTQVEATSFAMTDDLGREVEIPVHPQRVLALNSSMIESLFDLGITPVGVVSEYLNPRPEAEDLPSIGLENSPNIEVINQLAPELIIAHVRNHAQLLDSLTATGAAVFYIDPSTSEDQLIGKIELLGEVLNRQEEASQYVTAVQEKAELLCEKLADGPIKTTLMIQGGSQNIMAAQDFCFWGKLMSYLGLENIVPEEVAKTSKAGFVTFDMETIIQQDPDVILILQPGFRSAGGGSGSGGGSDTGSGKAPGGGPGSGQSASSSSMTPEELLAMYQEDPMWQSLSAVKNGNIYLVPLNVSPGRIGVEDALDVMAELLMPGISES